MRMVRIISCAVISIAGVFVGVADVYASEVSQGEYVPRKKTEPVISEDMLRFKSKHIESQLNIDFIRLILRVRDVAISRNINDIDYINATSDFKVLPLQEVKRSVMPYSRAKGFEFLSPVVGEHYLSAKKRFLIEYFRNDENGRVDFIVRDVDAVTCITVPELKERMSWLRFNMYRGVGVMHAPPDYDDRYVFALEDSKIPYRIVFWISFGHQSFRQPEVTCLKGFGANEAGSRLNFFASHFYF